MRRIIGTIVGMALAIALVDGSWELAGRWYPPAIAPDASDQDMLAHFVLRIGQWRPGGWLAAIVVVAAGVWNLTQLAQPLWLQAATVMMPVFGTWLAERHFHRARPGDPLIN